MLQILSECSLGGSFTKRAANWGASSFYNGITGNFVQFFTNLLNHLPEMSCISLLSKSLFLKWITSYLSQI